MKFSDFVCRDAIRTHLEADDKETVIRAMGTALVEAGRISQDNYESIIAAILKREELGSTGIGRGVAVPHTKHPAVDKLVGTVAISEDGRALKTQTADVKGGEAETLTIEFTPSSPGAPTASAQPCFTSAGRSTGASTSLPFCHSRKRLVPPLNASDIDFCICSRPSPFASSMWEPSSK